MYLIYKSLSSDEHGFLGMGHDYIDECEDDNCMVLLTRNNTFHWFVMITFNTI